MVNGNVRNVPEVKVDNFANNNCVGGICETDHTNVSQKLMNATIAINIMISLKRLVMNDVDKHGQWFNY